MLEHLRCFWVRVLGAFWVPRPAPGVMLEKENKASLTLSTELDTGHASSHFISRPSCTWGN